MAMVMRSTMKNTTMLSDSIRIRCLATKTKSGGGGGGGGDKNSPARSEEVQRLLYQAEERYNPTGVGALQPIPRITIDHVTITYANTGGGQNVNRGGNTKVDMRFNVKNATWLTDRVRERIMQMEKNRINKDGEIVISSTKTRAQKSNSEEALAKLQVFAYQRKKLQDIIDAASYVPLPPSEDAVKKIANLAVIAEQKRLEKKKPDSQKKTLRRSYIAW